MMIFALSQTVVVALIRPLLDDVLMPPDVKTKQIQKHETREDKTKNMILNAVLNRDQPEGQRGWLVNQYDRQAKRLSDWWNQNPGEKWRKVLTPLISALM